MSLPMLQVVKSGACTINGEVVVESWEELS